MIERLRHMWLRLRIFFGLIDGVHCEGRGIGKKGALLVWVCDRCGRDVSAERAW